MAPRVARRNATAIKSEAPESDMVDRTRSPSATIPPPATPQLGNHGPGATQPFKDNQSATMPFARSGAPSITTHTHSHDQTPLFLETRFRQPLARQTASPTNEASFAQGSFARPAFADIGKKLKACNDTLGNLQQLGIQHVARLPELVLVGDQSAGKSSLMSGLAELNLPRSGGVCTRCPIHIRMASSNVENFSCTVSLQLDYSFQPSGPIDVSEVTKENPFPPWIERRSREVKLFKTIDSPDDTEIEEVLKWAQLAILSPTKSAELFVPGEGAIAKEFDIDAAKKQSEAQFSPNIVALEMKGPGLPDLSFYDLPGVFLSPDDEQDEYIVQVVQNLARAYIQRPEAIIMWALPMNHDLENSIILPIIRKARATDRTIGVITKADMLNLQESNIKQWLDVLEGKKQMVKHGYFLTSLPPDQPLEKGTHWEEQFFHRGVSTWPTQFGAYSDRCGVNPLRDYISVQLGEAFSKSLPFIKRKVQERLSAIEARLGMFPELPKNVEHEVINSFNNFLRQVKADVKDRAMSSKWDKLNTHFKECIIKIKPACNVTEAPQTIDLDSDAESVNTPSKRPRASDSTVRTPVAKRQRPDLVPQQTPSIKLESNTPNRQSTFGPTPPPEPSPFTPFLKLGSGGLDLREIRRVILDQKKAGMPANLVPETVYEYFSLRAVSKWKSPLDVYLQKTIELLSETLHKALENSLADFKSRLLYRKMAQSLESFVAEQGCFQQARLAEMYEAETYQMFTMNNDLCDQFRVQELELMERARLYERLRANALLPWDTKRPDPAKMSTEAKAKEKKMLLENLAKLPAPDQFETELKVAAHIRAYYLTAATSFIEAVTKDVNARIFRNFTTTALDQFLGDELEIVPFGTREVYTALMEEDSRIAAERANLKKEQEKLERAMNSINALESDSSQIPTGFDSHVSGTNFYETYEDGSDDIMDV